MLQKRHASGHIGAHLAQVRKSRSLSQGKLAKAIGVTVGTIQAYEHGRARITLERLIALAEAFQYEPVELLKHLLKPATISQHPMTAAKPEHARVRASRAGNCQS
jgi:transcriptional regulator with XRE-family HTH domain